MKKIKVAVVGCGSIAESCHIPSYLKNPATELEYLVDIRYDHVKEIASKYNIKNFTDDHRKILKNNDIDVVSVCTPNESHKQISVDFLNAGKSVLCEKPAAIDFEQAKEMKAAADKNQKTLNIGFVNRYNTAVNKIKETIESGELGEIYHIYCSFRSYRSIPGLGGWFTTKSRSGGGVLIDWGVHFLDLIFYCTGIKHISSVSAGSYCKLGKGLGDYSYVDMWAGPPDLNGTYDVEDFTSGFIRTSGPTISFNGAWAQNIDDTGMYIEFLGDKAGIKLQYGSDYRLYKAEGGALYDIKPSFSKSDPFYDEIDDFLRASKSNIKTRQNIDFVLITSEVVEAIYRSSELGKEVKV